MTVTRFGNNRYEGLSTDTKPTGVPVDSIFYETDTQIFYRANGSGSWAIQKVSDTALSATAVTTTATQTLTNKTLTSPVISTIVNTGTLTLPTATTTIVGRTTTDTLTNKTLTTPVISTISNTGTLTLPTSTDTLVGRATADTLTNKTLTSPVISSITNTGTLTLPTATDILVGRSTTDSLANKTLTSPTISTIINTGTITLPTSTDTLIGRATTDTLTNKTVDGTLNNVANVAQRMFTVYKDNGTNTYKAKNELTGTIDSSNADAAVVLQYAVDNSTFAGSIVIRGGVYTLASSVNAKSSILIQGEGRENVLIRPTGNFPAFIIGATTGVQHVNIRDVLFYHNQSGYTSSLLQFTGNAQFNMIKDCDFWSGGFVAGNAISFENVGAANAGVGICWNRVIDCNIIGFNNGIFMSTANGGSPINFVNDNNFQNVSCDKAIRFLKCSGVANSDIDHNRFINCTFQSGNTAAGNAPAVAFDYDDAANHAYTVHVGCITWDLPTGVKYANVNANMGGTMSLIGCVPVSNDTTFIGGSGAASTNIRTEMSLSESHIWTGYNQFLLTAAGGFEDVIKIGINGSADYFSMTNNTNVSGSFSPIIRSNQTSTNVDRFTPGLYFQSIVKVANDTSDSEGGIVFSTIRTGGANLTGRPIATFKNGLATDIVTIYPTYMDMRGNQIQNSVMGGMRWAVTTKTASYTATDTDVVILCDTTSSAITITLPAASGRSGKFYAIHRKAGTTNAITIDPNASETIDGAATITVPTTAASSKWIFCDGTAWYSK